MAGLQIRKATKTKSKARVGLCSPAGGGKTFGALAVATGMGGKVCLIDTEAGSGDLYSDKFDYDICPIEAPFTVEKYLEAINLCECNGYDTIIIDSLTHAWASVGGLLEKVGTAQRNGANSFTAWKDVTPLHNRLIDAILQSKCHIIATMRTKTEYVIEQNEKGKSVPRKIGMAPVQRAGMDYEFTLVFDIDQASHLATATKDRTSIFDGHDVTLDQSVGKKLMEWLNAGAEHVPDAKATTCPTPSPTPKGKVKVAEPEEPVEDLF